MCWPDNILRRGHGRGGVLYRLSGARCDGREMVVRWWAAATAEVSATHRVLPRTRTHAQEVGWREFDDTSQPQLPLEDEDERNMAPGWNETVSGAGLGLSLNVQYAPLALPDIAIDSSCSPRRVDIGLSVVRPSARDSRSVLLLRL